VTRVVTARELRFVVPGVAVSFRSPASAEYKRRIRKAARPVFRRWGAFASCQVRIDYFHETPRRFDVDNVLKCVLDALNGLAYKDDRVVTEAPPRAHDLRGMVHLPDGPLDLIKPLRRYRDYLFVRVRAAGQQGVRADERRPGL